MRLVRIPIRLLFKRFNKIRPFIRPHITVFQLRRSSQSMNPGESIRGEGERGKVSEVVVRVSYGRSMEHGGSRQNWLHQQMRFGCDHVKISTIATHSSGRPESLVTPISAAVSLSGCSAAAGAGIGAGGSGAAGGCPGPCIPGTPGMPIIPGGRNWNCPSGPGIGLPQPSIPA